MALICCSIWVAQTRWVLQELGSRRDEAPATSGCWWTHVPCTPLAAPGTLRGFTLARPKDCTDFQATRGFRQPPALTQAAGLFHKPRVCGGADWKGTAQLILCLQQMLSPSSSVPASLVLGLALHTHLLCSDCPRGCDEQLCCPRRRRRRRAGKPSGWTAQLNPHPAPRLQWEALLAAPPLLSHTLQFLFSHL